MAESIKQRMAAYPDKKTAEELTRLFQADNATLRAAITGITAKLDADAGVTDTNYGALWNPTATTGISA